jgi:2-dehydro-3-deoxyphosphogluconate aldolase / (4S)-4-hydroxy-2-oxoglutarate aldolase
MTAFPLANTQWPARTRFLPIITIADASDAVPLAQALLAGGVDAIEFTLRTPAAMDAIEQVARKVPNMFLGAGTVSTLADFDAASAAGAQFFVSPGFDPLLAPWPLAHNKLWLPGVQTASEIMIARRLGFTRLKFFPAEAAGGVSTLKALAPVHPEIRYYPTGSITQAKVKEYLALECVGGVGGSWVAPAAMVKAKDWAGITALAKMANE